MTKGLRSPLSGVKNPFGGKKSIVPFTITLTGLSTDFLGTFGEIGSHAFISYIISPDLGTETVKWSNSSNPAAAATFGTGASPTDFAASEGNRVYLHVTDDPVDNPDVGPVTRTFSFLAREELSIALTAAGPQEADGDLPLSYTTNFDLTGQLVVYDDAEPTPAAADFGGANPTYVDQGEVTLTTSGSPINLDIVGTFDASVRLAFLPNGGGNANVVVSPTFTLDTSAPTISTLSPADGAVSVATTANLVMTFSEAMKQQGTVELRNVGGSLIQSFNLASAGVWSAGDTVWTGDPSSNFTADASLCVRWSGLEDTTGNPLADNTVDTAWNFTVAAAPTGLTLLTQSVVTSANANNRDFTVTGVAGETVTMVFAFGGGVPTLNSVTVDPGGGNQTTATIRQALAAGNCSIALADVVWPATGALTVRSNWSLAISNVGITAMSAGSKVYQTGGTGSTSGKAAPQDHILTVNTSAGDSVLLAAVLVSSGASVSTVTGVDTVVGTFMDLAGTRDGYVTKKDSAVGATPETFEMEWVGLGFAATQGLVGVYR